MKEIRKLVKPGAIIQGGAFRLDKGPTSTELRTFKLAVSLVEGLIKEKQKVSLACIVNDLAISSEKRPKITGLPCLPDDYISILKDAGLSDEFVLLFYESTLRNRASKDLRKNNRIAHSINDNTGIPVPICASIMGRFYANLAEMGFSQEIGFFAQEPKPEDDTACPFGPIKGAREGSSGYTLGIEIVTYFVYSDGRIGVGGVNTPEEKE